MNYFLIILKTLVQLFLALPNAEPLPFSKNNTFYLPLANIMIDILPQPLDQRQVPRIFPSNCRILVAILALTWPKP